MDDSNNQPLPEINIFLKWIYWFFHWLSHALHYIRVKNRESDVTLCYSISSFGVESAKELRN